MAEIDVTKLIDINGLALFLEQLDNRFYSQASATSYQNSVNQALAGKANKNGSPGEDFVANNITIGSSTNNNSVRISSFVSGGTLYLSFSTRTTSALLPLVVDSNGEIVTEGSLNINRMYDASSGGNFVLTPHPSVFLKVVNAESSSGTIQGSEGSIIYYKASIDSEINEANNFGDINGFYLVTGVDADTKEVTSTIYIGDADPYTIYFMTSRNIFYIFNGTFVEINAPSVPVVVGNDNEWSTATAEDIAAIFN